MTALRLPDGDHSPFLRTDFTDDQEWQALLNEIGDAWMTVLADPRHRDLSIPELVMLVPDGSRYPVLVVADDVTFSSAERTVVVVDVRTEPGRTFRAVPDACRSAVANLAIGNGSFDDYLNLLDDSGVYRLSDRHRQALAQLQASLQPNTGHPQARIPGPGASRANPGRPSRPSQAGRASTPKKPGLPPNS